MIDNTQLLNKLFFNTIGPRIEIIFKQQKIDNKKFKFDQEINLLRFKIYFLGTIDKNIQSFEIKNKNEIETIFNQ